MSWVWGVQRDFLSPFPHSGGVKILEAGQRGISALHDRNKSYKKIFICLIISLNFWTNKCSFREWKRLISEKYPEQPVCTSLLFTLLFIKSQYTVFLICTSYCFLDILWFFAHLVVFCTSCCLLHILLSFAHLIVFCTSYCFALFISLHILLLFLLFLPYVCPCVMSLYIICILIILHCPLSGPDSITFHF